jgi:gamma-glutamyltranspeptidase/glutathione hydrolase
MVVSVEAQATRAGVEVLSAGGNAVDAAVATAYALAVAHPSAGNIGGGGFMLIARVGEPVVAIDFRERSPASLTPERFDQLIEQGPFGPAASAVPGSVAGLNAAQRRFGRLSLRQVMTPALRLARDGHVVGPRESMTLGWSWARLARDPEALRTFGVRGRPVRAGARLVRADLARTLERIASEGDAGFYSGPTARAIARSMGSVGLISEADLQAYRAVERTPLTFAYRGYEIATMPPPSSGGVAIRQMLLALDRLGARALAPGSAAELHLLLEVSKRAQASRRSELLDPDAAPETMETSRLLSQFSPERLLEAAPAIDVGRATPARDVSPLYDVLGREPDQTTHFSVVDADGNAVSCTTTLSSGFGAGYVVPGTGIVMNNSLPAFSRAGLNLPAGGRRMLSSMSPTIVSADGRPAIVLGSPGGDTIPSTVVQILRHLLDHGMSIDQAVEAPRIHHGFVPDVVRYEKNRPWPRDVLLELERLGHVLEAKGAPIGDAKNIAIVGGQAQGHADTREGGLAAGPVKAKQR